MRIDFTPKMSALVVSHGNDETTWQFSAWTQLKPENVNVIQGPMNSYLESLPQSDQDELARLYRNAFNVFEDETNLNDIRNELTDIVKQMIDVIDFERARIFFKDFKGFQLPTVEEEIAGKHYPEASTYDRAQVHDLHVLSIVIKILSPLMGYYMKHIQSSVGDWKEIECLSLFDTSSIIEHEVWKKLERYTHNTLFTKTNMVKAAAVTHDMSHEKLKRHAMALAIARRLTICRHSEDGKDTIIKYIARFVGYQFDHFSSTVFRDKNTVKGSNDIEDESVADRYRIPEEVPLSIPALGNKYIEDLDAIARNMTVEIDPEDLRVLVTKLKKSDFNVGDVHLMLISLVTNRIVHTHTLKLLDTNSVITLAAASSLCFHNMGRHGLSQLSVAIKRDRDYTSMDMADVNTRVFKKLDPQLAIDLAECYPYIKDVGKTAKTSNPGYVFIEKLVEFCTGFDWEGLENKEDIRDEIAKVLIDGFVH